MREINSGCYGDTKQGPLLLVLDGDEDLGGTSEVNQETQKRNKR